MVRSIIIGTCASILGLATLFALEADAQTVSPPIVVLTPDIVTGTVVVKISTNTDDVRYSRTCYFRIDPASPDPAAEVACADLRIGGTPSDPLDPTKGVTNTMTVPVTIITGQDQLFGAKNFATVAGTAEEIPSAFSTNSAVMPGPIQSPLFIVRGG